MSLHLQTSEEMTEMMNAALRTQEPELMGSLGFTTRQQVTRRTCTHTRQPIIFSRGKAECKEKAREGTERMRKL